MYVPPSTISGGPCALAQSAAKLPSKFMVEPWKLKTSLLFDQIRKRTHIEFNVILHRLLANRQSLGL
jgi:hypothetical protein